MAESAPSDHGADAASLAVSLRGVTKAYVNGVIALGPFDLDVRQGEFVSLLGPAWCVKSTALRLIAGLAASTEGSVQVSRHCSRDCGYGRAGQALRLAFQAPALFTAAV